MSFINNLSEARIVAYSVHFYVGGRYVRTQTVYDVEDAFSLGYGWAYESHYNTFSIEQLDY